MKISLKTIFRIAIPTLAILFVCGCGNNTTPTVSSSQDELTKYLDEHPELKDVSEETATASGGV